MTRLRYLNVSHAFNAHFLLLKFIYSFASIHFSRYTSKICERGLKWFLQEVRSQICYLCMRACVPSATLVQTRKRKINFLQLHLLFFFFGEKIMGARYASMREYTRSNVLRDTFIRNITYLKHNTGWNELHPCTIRISIKVRRLPSRCGCLCCAFCFAMGGN